MKRALIQPDKCQNCQPCAIDKDCPMHAIFRENAAEKPWIDFYRCSGCLRCKTFCPNEAIKEISHPCSGKGQMGW